MIKNAVLLGNTKSPMGRPEPYSWFVLTYKQGLELNGVNVHFVDYKSNSIQKIKEKIISINPDVVFTHLSFHFNLRPTAQVLQMQRDIIKATGTRFIHVTMDARRDDRYMGDISDSFYMAFVGNFEMLERGKKAWKIPAYYSPYSSLNYDKMAKPVSDLTFPEAIFCGSPTIHPDRHSFIQRLQQKIPVRIFQTQSGNDLRNRTPELSVSSKLMLCLCTGYDINGYIDVRPWQFLGTGACCAIRRFKNMDNLIPRNLYWGFDTYNDNDVNKVVEYYQRSLREDTVKMRQEAFNFIQKHHSCKNRIKDILDAIDGKDIPNNAYDRRWE
jgi:hypothetical protein